MCLIGQSFGCVGGNIAVTAMSIGTQLARQWVLWTTAPCS